MSIELGPILTVAERRIDSVPRREVYIPLSPHKTKRMRRVVSIFVTAVEEFIGEENLDEVMELAKKGILMGVGNHLTDLDPASRRYALESRGRQDIADRFTYFVGWKMYERWYTNIWMGAEHSVNGPTPADMNLAEEALASFKGLPVLSAEQTAQREILQTYRKLLEERGTKANSKLSELKKEGFIPYIFPESTRSRTGLLTEAPPRIGAQFIRDREGYIFSMVVTGQELPVPVGGIYKPWRRGPIRVKIGKPYPVKNIQNWRQEGKKTGEERNPGEYVMAHIAALLPDDNIDPRVLGKYRAITPAS